MLELQEYVALLNHVLDTCVFNWLLDGHVSSADLPAGIFVATHIQWDELSRTPNGLRRSRLQDLFVEVVDVEVATESALVGISIVGGCKISDGERVRSMKKALDAANGGKSNNWNDALIAEVALAKGWCLVTADVDLGTMADSAGCAICLLRRA